MPRGRFLPEKSYGTPHPVIWPAGTALYRVHERRYAAREFNATLVDPHFGGARFDSTPNDVYSYYYAAPQPQTALAETLLRELPFVDAEVYTLPRAAVQGYQLSKVELARDVKLLSLLSTPALRAVEQDYWLVHAEAPEYPFTRRWGHWIRAQAPWAQGFVWTSKRDLPNEAIVLFADRFPVPSVEVVRDSGEPTMDLDDDVGIGWLNDVLKEYRVCVSLRD